MSTTNPAFALILDLLEWLEDRPRPYAEVMDAWRTSCPRLSIWEDALADGLVRTERSFSTEPTTTVAVITDRGRDVLAAAGRGLVTQPRGSAETPRSVGIHADPELSGADSEDWLRLNWRPR
jgi:hypothetical protein